MLLVAVATLSIDGCTFAEQATDLLEGGPERRVEAAQQRQQAALNTQTSLRHSQQALAEEHARQGRRLAELNRQIRKQDAKIARARVENRITQARAQALRQEIAALNGSVQDLELRIQTARVTGDSEETADLEKRLQQLQAEAHMVEQEVELLEEE